MVQVVADRVWDTSTTTGTGALTLSGVGFITFRTFDQVCAVGDTCEIVIVHPSADEYEVCEAAYSATDTLTRGTVISSSNSGALVNFTAGIKDVILTVPARNARASPPGMTNRLINGGMAIDQQNEGTAVSATATGGHFLCDRWSGFGTASAGVYSAQQTAMSAGDRAITGQSFYERLTTTTASASPAAGELYLFYQFIEGRIIADAGFGATGAKNLAISFWVRSSLTGTFSGGVQNGGQNQTYLFSYTIAAANTWEYKSFDVPGRDTGTWNTNHQTGMGLIFDLGCGSTYLSSPAGAWSASAIFGLTGGTRLISTNAATLDFTGVQLEVNSGVTSFEHRGITAELALCQRYYQKTYSQGTAPGTVTTTGQIIYYTQLAGGGTISDVGGMIVFPVEMRNTPTITFYSPATGATGKFRDTVAIADVTATSYTPGTTRVGWLASLSSANAQAFLTGHMVADSRLS